MNPVIPESFLVVTTPSVPGRRVVRYCGLARGNSVRGASLQKDLLAGMQNLVGGEIPEYTKILAECREEALDRMVDHAKALGANAIVGMRFTSSEVATQAAELLAYGTAVIVEVAPDE